MKHLFFLLTLLFCLPLSAQQTYSARVVDTETGEALPYVYVYITKEQHVNTCGTVTDAQGCFECSATPNSTLLFSCVGYEKLTLKASNLKKTVRLTPLVTLMNELTVSPTSAQKYLKKPR